MDSKKKIIYKLAYISYLIPFCVRDNVVTDKHGTVICTCESEYIASEIAKLLNREAYKSD